MHTANRSHRPIAALMTISVTLLVACSGDPPANNGLDGGRDAATDIGRDVPADLGGDMLTDADDALAHDWNFENGTLQGFDVDRTDYSDTTPGDLQFSVEPMPGDLEGQGVEIVALNESDDLWHFLAREIGADEGVQPNTTYTATLEVHVASNEPGDCAGVGGPPDAVWLKGGVVDERPQPVQVDDRTEFSIAKGNQSQVGPEAVDLGDIGTSNTDCTGDGPWHLLQRSGTMLATSTDDATLWVYVGGDSGFEAATTLYYDLIRVTLVPQ